MFEAFICIFGTHASATTSITPVEIVTKLNIYIFLEINVRINVDFRLGYRPINAANGYWTQSLGSDVWIGKLQVPNIQFGFNTASNQW